MDLQASSIHLPGKTLVPSTSKEMLSNDAEEDSDSELGSENEEAEEETESSDSDCSTGDSVNCPICLLKFRGQAIGFPEICGHPFCLDCILEWSKNVQTCPNDRQKFENILVRLDLDGQVVKKIPVSAPNKGEEDNNVQDVTNCQICRQSDREDVLLLCDRCDQGCHMDCLDPPIYEVPIEDWFCPQCLGTQPLAASSSTRAPLALRVRRTIQRSRQRILRDSSVTRRTRKTKTKRKTTKKAGSRRKRKAKTKAKTRKSNKPVIPSPRKRLADTLGIGEKSSGNVELGSHFSLFGNPNDLDSVEDEENSDILSAVTRPKNEPKSLIAQLAARRKAAKSIFAFGPVASLPTAAKPAKPAPNHSTFSNGDPDLLGSILAAQSQMTLFGKATEPVIRPKPKTNSSNRVLGAILASQATLSLLSDVNRSVSIPSKVRFQENSQSGKRCAGQQNEHSSSQTGNSSQGSVSQSLSQPQANGHSFSARGSLGAGCSGGDDGEDPNKNRHSRPEPMDKQEIADEEQQTAKDVDSDDKNSEEDDEKGLVIDDSNAEDAESKSPEDQSKQEASNKKSNASCAPEVCKFQHGGLPAAAAALSYGPKIMNRPQPRPRSTSAAGPTIDEMVKANLVSSIASALKESLTSALLAQTQPDALVDHEDIPLPPPTYSDSKTSDSPEPVVPKDPSADLKYATPIMTDEIKAEASPVKLEIKQEPKDEVKSESKPSRKRRMEEIFGSDDDESKNQADQLEQISDCEEGELDESEAEGMSEREPRPSGNRIVRMLTPPPTSEKHRSSKNGDCEEGEIVDKKAAKQKSAKKKKTDEVAVSVDDEILREAGIGGERRVEMCIEDESIPSTFKKLDSGKTRHYRHQGDIKVIEGKAEVKVKKEQEDEKQRSKKQEIKRYDVRRVVEQRTAKGDGSHRSRSESRATKKKSRKRSSSSSSVSSSSSSTSLSSLSPERSRRRKRSHSSSSDRKRKSKVRSRSRDKKKKSKKKKKMKDKHKERKLSIDRTGQDPEPEGEDFEIPSKAVFASGDKIVVSLHFGSSGTSKQPIKKKKLKSESKERSSKKSKDDKKSSSKSSKSEAREFKSELTKESYKVERPSPEPKLKSETKSDSKSKPAEQKRSGEKMDISSKKMEPEVGRAAVRPRPPRPIRPRGKPVLIDIETSREIPIEDTRPSDIIVLSDSDVETSMTIIDSASIPLPPTPPPPLPSELPPEPPKPEPPPESKPSEPAKQLPKLPPIKPLIAPRPRGSRGGLLLKQQGASVKFSLSSKANSLKKVNNPIFQAAEEEDDKEEENDDQQSANQDGNGHRAKAEESKDGEASSSSPKKLSDTQSKKTSASPIFRPSTPPSPANASYDPSHPTRSPSSGDSTPCLSPKPRQVPPLPPPPTPPVLSGFPLPHPGAVLIPPMTSLPPPPLPPPPMLAQSFRPSAQLVPVYNTSIPPPVTIPLPSATPQSLSAKLPPIVSVKPPPSVPSKPLPQPPVSTPSKSGGGRPMTPPSPTPSEGSDIFGPPSASPSSPSSDQSDRPKATTSSKPRSQGSGSSGFDSLFQSTNKSGQQGRAASKHHGSSSSRAAALKDKSSATDPQAASSSLALTQDGEELPSSAVELQVKEKFLKKLNRQERVVEEVRLALKPYYTAKKISKGDYKEILRKCVPKICHTKSGEINPIKIKEMVKAYVKKFRYQHKKEVVAQ